MLKLNLPPCELRLKKEGGKTYVFDAFRKKYLVLTPEEWVRQSFLTFLVQHKNYPSGLIEIEKGLKLNELSKRADSVIYKHSSPYVLLEFKAPSVPIRQDVFEQIARYNSHFKVPYLFVSNGLDHYCAKIDFDSNSFEFVQDIPDYSEI